MTPFFSVVIPLYNKEKHVKSTLNSVISQNFADFEVIIVNDGSTDNSIAVVNSIIDSRISVFTTKNHGVSHARNFGISKAKANYIAFLDADDLWKPFHLKDLKVLIENFPNCGMYCKAYEKRFFKTKTVPIRINNLENGFNGIVTNFFDKITKDSLAWTSATVVPKKVLNKYNNFDIKLRSGQDTYLWIKIALENKVAFSSKISAIKVIDSLTNHLSFSKNRIDRVKLLDRFKLQEQENKYLKKYMDLNRFSVAIERKIAGDHTSFNEIIKNIDVRNLNKKQRFLLVLPKFFLQILMNFKYFLLKKKFYLSPFR